MVYVAKSILLGSQTIQLHNFSSEYTIVTSTNKKFVILSRFSAKNWRK